jgi:hypothetical protein
MSTVYLSNGLKRQCHEIFASGFFHESVSPQPRSIPLGPFKIFSKIRGEIRKSRCTTGINDNGGKIVTGINDIGGKFATGINAPTANFSTSFSSVLDTGGKIATSVNETGGKQWEQLSNC